MEKADNFSQRLANRLSEYDLQDADVEMYFKSAISSLATKQNDLHDYLLEHFDTQLSVFKRHLTLTQPTFELNSPNQSKLDGKSLTSELLTHHSDKQMLVNILKARSQERQGNNLADLSKLILGINANELHHVATSIFKYYDGIFSKLLVDKTSIKQMKEIKQEMLNVSFLLRSKQSFIGEKESGGAANINEVLEALFSLVIDLGGIEDGSLLVEKANLILGDNVQVWLNTVLQITTPLSDCATFLVPFLRHILLDRQWPQNPTLLQYIQYMLLTKQVMSMNKMEPSLAEKFRSTGLKYAAPLMFYEMVVESGAGVDLLDLTPIVRDSTPSFITKYFVDEADEELLADLLDACLAKKPSKEFIEEIATLQESDTVKEPEEKVEMLFYVDKAPTKFINEEVDDSSQDATEDDSSQEMTEANVDCENTNLQDELITEESTDIDTNIPKLKADQLPCTPQQTVRKRKCSSARSVRTSKLCKPPVKPLTPHVEGKVTKVRKSSAARTDESYQKKLCRNKANLMESPAYRTRQRSASVESVN